MRKGQTTYYEYDAAGKLRQSVLVDGSGSNATNLLGTSYGYDEKSRLTDAFYGFDYYAPGGYKAEDLYYRYQYHDDDKLQSMRFETTDRRVTGSIVPTYDNLGRTASRVSFFLVNSADAFYREEGFSYNTYYDAEYGLVCQSAQVSEYTSGIAVSGTAAQDVTTYGFTYDENGNITEICDSEGSVQRKYYYDDLGQLVREDNRALGKTYVWTYIR